MKKLVILALLILFIATINATGFGVVNSDFGVVNSDLVEESSSEPEAECGGAVQCNCYDRLTSDQVMWYDITGCSFIGLRIRNSDITLDCNGHTIEGDYSMNSGDDGISIIEQTGVTIKNCIVKGFYDGIYTRSVTDTDLINNEVYDNRYGVRLLDSNRNTVSENTIYNNAHDAGVKLEYAYENEITGNTIYTSVTGVFLEESSYNTVSGNNLNNNGYSGIGFISSTNNEISNNEITDNGNIFGADLWINSVNNTFWNNTFTNNGENTYEDATSVNNDWNFGTQGNYWDDFESNPGYPNYYEAFGEGDGIDWHPNIEEETFECGMWGDVTGEGEVNPLDVVYMVNYVYKGFDLRVQPENCPYEAGDVTCEGEVNPLDVVYFVNFVYKQDYRFCDPCEGLPNCNVEFPN